MNSHALSHSLTNLTFAVGTILSLLTGEITAQPTASEYLSDELGLVASTSQAWGELGWNVAAHGSGQPGLPLQIADRTYAKGLGHHANGSVILLLDGQYSALDAEVGLQPCAAEGSVIFRVFTDGEKRFDSGTMRTTNAPKPLHVELTGAQELRLEANDAGDGITCDVANWADARLTRASITALAATEPAVDMAPFARVVTWNPNRLDGARASRIEEFHAEDLFLETDLPRQANGFYAVPVSTNGLSCVGLQWLNRRALKSLMLEFSDAATMPPTNGVWVQGWFGESAWQGGWKPLAGDLRTTGKHFVLNLLPRAGAVQTQKIRWVLPTAGKPLLCRLSAFTRSRWQTVQVHIETEKQSKGGQGRLELFNGDLISLQKGRSSNALLPWGRHGKQPHDRVTWDLSKPLILNIRCSRPSLFKSDPTVLQFHLPSGAFGVAILDVLSNDCVYLPDHGLFITRNPAPVTLSDYKRKIADRQTILQEVRALPDQSLAQAMAKTHHDAQREGPVMLSLACDNAKFVLDRDGTLHFQVTTNVADDWFATAGEMRPRFGGTPPRQLTRCLDGNWLPIPIITVEDHGVLYRQRTFVAPCDDPGDSPARLNRPSLCVAEFTLTNTLAEPAQATLTLSFLTQTRQKQTASLTRCAAGYFMLGAAAPFALAATDTATPLEASAKDNELRLSGTLAPHGSTRFSVLLPAGQPPLPTAPDVARFRAETETYWTAALAPALQVETPDPLLNHLVRSSQIRCLIAARNEAGGSRVAPWIAAMSYGPLESEAHSVIRGMDFMGYGEFARRGLDYFISRYNTNGFLTTGYTTFGTAWHLWTLGEHYQLYRDTNWLQQVAPDIARAGAWIVRQTDKTKRTAAVPSHPPEFGFMPPGVLADWNSFAYHFAMNAYYYAALREVGSALSDLARPNTNQRLMTPKDYDQLPNRVSDLGLPSAFGLRLTDLRQPAPALPSGAFFTRRAADLRANILRAYRWTQSQSPALPLRDGTWIPLYPSQVHSPGKLGDFFPGQDAGRSWCYDVEIGAHQLVPTGVLDPQDREVGRILDHMEDVQFLSEGWFDYPATMNEKDWFNLGGFSKVQPYYTRNCEVYALRDDVKAFVRSYFNTIAAMLNPEVLTFWEHFNHSGAWDKTHETGYFLHQTRTMLLTERGDQLWLAPLITSNWLKDGMVVAVTNAPTRFGPVTYRVTSHVKDGYIEASIEPPTRNLPQALVLRLRHPEGQRIRSVTVNGKSHRDFDATRDCIVLDPTRERIVVTAQY